MNMNKECLFTEKPCEDKPFCECCPIWYDWAVYYSEIAAKMYYKKWKEEKEDSDSLSF